MAIIGQLAGQGTTVVLFSVPDGQTGMTDDCESPPEGHRSYLSYDDHSDKGIPRVMQRQ